ncbi:unnamed protein product [Calypogeia fissa]
MKLVKAGEHSRPESMSDQTAMVMEQNLVSRLLHQRTMSADGAQPSNTSEQQSVNLGGRMSNSMPEEGERGRGLLRIAQKLQYSRTMSKRLSPRSERMVANKIKELELKSPQLSELVVRHQALRFNQLVWLEFYLFTVEAIFLARILSLTNSLSLHLSTVYRLCQEGYLW